MNIKRILVISGPTGVGESTITNKIIKRYPIFVRLVTATTRKPRLNELHGKDYYFFNRKFFFEEIEKGNIIEHTHVEKRDVYYGSYKPDLDKKMGLGFNIIINPDLVGAKYYKEHYNATIIFIMPDLIENLQKRLFARDPKISKTELKKRLDHAKHEIDNESSFYDHIVINKQGQSNEAIEEVIKIIIKEGYQIKKNN